jgi:hypothetical protein
MWALTLPQVAATLAATLVAYDTRNAAGQRMLDSTMLNAVLVPMLATCILGPVSDGTLRTAHASKIWPAACPRRVEHDMNFATDTLPPMALMTTVGGLTRRKALAPIHVRATRH